MDDFVKRDHELEAAHERSGEVLAEHRWHWTLDESNPERVSLKQYARTVHRSYSVVHADATGFAVWREQADRIDAISLSDCKARARIGAEKAEAAEAVAAARGVSLTTATTGSAQQETQAVLDMARDRVERKGTSLSEEIPAVAEWRETARRAHASDKAASQRAKGLQLVQLEGHLGKAIRDLREALALAREIDFDDEQVELISDTLASLRNIVGLIDVRLTGSTGVDWDRAFADVMEAES